MAAADAVRHDNVAGALTEGIELRDFALRPLSPTETYAQETDSTTGWYAWCRGPFALDVDHQACRDHFALERTFLAFIRTANAFAQVGVAIAWLFRIHIAVNSIQDTTSLRAGKAIGAATICVAIVVALCGTEFFAMQQQRIVRGVVTAKPWTDWIIFASTVTLLCALFVLLLVSDTWRQLARNET